MKARAPGKVVLTGAYAVLHGAPALVVAVDRHAVADPARPDPAPSAELRAAFGTAVAPSVDTRALYEAGHKLGLGSSAAVVVAALATTYQAAELATDAARQRLFQAARRAHAEAQGGGSGVDIAASTYGGILEYRQGDAAPRRRPWPAGLAFDVYFAGHSAKTSSLLSRVRELGARDPALHGRVIGELCEASEVAASALGEPGQLVAAAQRFGRALAALGEAAGAPIVTPAFAELAAIAETEGAAFFGAGAGGGDVAVRLGTTAVSREFEAHVGRVGLLPVRLQVDHSGAVHVPFSAR